MKTRLRVRIIECVVFVLAIGLILPMCGRAAGNGNLTGEVVEVGVFEIGPGKPGSREVRFPTHGEVFTARLGLQFGFRFTLKNVLDSPYVDLITIVTHPPIVDKEGVTKTHYKLITTIPVANGSATSVTGYKFDRPEEMTPGVWTFEHSYHGKTLVKQSFTIRASDQGTNPEKP